MNNQTLTIFEDTNAKDIMIAIRLPNIQVKNSKQTDCIDISDKTGGPTKTVCAMAMLGTDHTENIMHWKEEIDFFANKCFKGMPAIAAKSNIVNLRQKQLDDAVTESMNGVGTPGTA